MTLTVATPVFNGMPWLQCCLASVRDQAGGGIEHIVHDGGSTDGSLEALAGAPGVQWTSERDGGMYDAVNRCWRQAKGDICAYLNADEQYLPGSWDAVREAFVVNPQIDIIFGDALVVNGRGEPLSYRRVVTPSRLHTRLAHLGTMSCAMFFRRLLLDRGLFFDTRWRAIGDAEWVDRALGLGVKSATVRVPLAAFALTGGNLGAKPSALAEARAWRAGVPAAVRAAAPLVKVAYWLRKLVAGAYRRRDVATALYTPASPRARVPVRAAALSPRWAKG